MNAQVKEIIADYFKSKPIEKAWVFGSFSRGEEKPNSDVDIMITFIPGTKMGLSYFGMIIDLEERLSRPVDLVVQGDLLPFAEASAEQDKVLVYERAS